MSKDKGKKKDKSAAPKLSKKEAKKLQKREAEIAAELARRAEKRTKKIGKKAKAAKISTGEQAAIDTAKAARKAKKREASTVEITEDMKRDGVQVGHYVNNEKVVEASAAVDPKSKKGKSKKRDEVIDPATGQTRPEVIDARNAEKLAKTAEVDAEIKARLQAKRAEREANAKPELARAADAADGETEAEYQMRHQRETKKIAKKAGLEVAAVEEAEAEPLVGGMIQAVRDERAAQAAEAVETEHGREFQVGESVNADPVSEFANPSDAAPRLESGMRGYKIIQLDKEGNPDPKVVRQYTRVTTYVGNIDDETSLKEWLLRLAVEGVALKADELLPRISDVAHRRDVTIAKAEKKDRKGALGLGELGRITEAANKEAKAALNAIVEEALDAAGRNDRADAGTHLHTLSEIVDASGIDHVREMHENGVTGDDGLPILNNDLAAMEAYADAMSRMGAEHIISEAVVVNDALRHAGRLDSIKFAKLPALIDPKTKEVVRPADGRRKRYVFDVKTGKIDFAAGKISRQLAAYAHADLYDIETGRRTPSGATRDVALVVHLPLNTGECHVYAVDLKEGYRLLKLSESVRAGRASGRKAIDTTIDLAAPAAVESEED